MHCLRSLFLGVMQKKGIKGFLKIKAEYNRLFFLNISYLVVGVQFLVDIIHLRKTQGSKLET